MATILFDAGATAPDVQATLAHSSLQITERYSRAREGVALRAGNVLEQHLAEQRRERPRTRPASEQSARGDGPRMAQLHDFGEEEASNRKTPDGLSL